MNLTRLSNRPQRGGFSRRVWMAALLGAVLVACIPRTDSAPTSTSIPPTSGPETSVVVPAPETSAPETSVAVPVPATSVPANVPTSEPGAPSSSEPAPTTTERAATTTEPDDTTTTRPPLARGEPIREWTFSEYRGDALELVELNSAFQVGGPLHELHDFGFTFRDADIIDLDGTTLPGDGIATGQIASSADGVTYWVGADAPRGNANLPEDPIGGVSLLTQTQSFAKLAPDASLSFTVSAAFIDTSDLNRGRRCPEIHAGGPVCDFIKGQLSLDVRAFTVPAAPDLIPFETFFHVSGGATLYGSADGWNHSAYSPVFSQVPLWDAGDFDFVIAPIVGIPGAQAVMILKEPRTFTIDLSALDVGQAFTLQSVAHVQTYNRIAGPPSEFSNSVSAFLRDPQSSGGTTVSFSGLEPIDDPGLEAPVDTPVEPAACPSEPAPDPDAGVLQFSADSYTLNEADPTPTVTITRTGGSTGAVTATVTTSDGTAIEGTDYRPVNASVFFADGDTAPRVVELPIVQDVVRDEPDKTVIITLSEPGGCAALGSPTTTELTIRDDDAPTPQPEEFGLDTTFGTEGKATSTAFGGDRSAMALQPDGKFVMVGGTFADFVVARFNADGTLDASFDSDGKVTTDVGGGFAQEEALGVAIQPDGKIVVAGYTDRTNVAVVRYNADGSLDTSFGSGGMVTSGVTGQAHDVIVQPDGKIVVAGHVSLDDADDFADVVVARYNADGALDPSFADGGQTTTDFGGVTNEGENVVVQPDGALVVSGSALDPGFNSVDHHTDVVRYTADGNLDTSFGTAGKATFDDALIGNDLTLQPDGKLVLVGAVPGPTAGPPGSGLTEFSIVRLDRAGVPDPTFGTAGAASVSVSALTSEFGIPDRDEANAVALQRDGKIVVGGTTTGINSNFALARLNGDGTLDTGFADAGVLEIDFFGFTDIGENVAVQDDGNIVISGLARDNVDGYGLARVLG